MASNTVLWNPLTLGNPNKTSRLLIYYNSSKGNLALRQWSAGNQWGTVWTEKEESAKGNVKVGGGFAALVWRDWIRVYGIISVDKSGTEVNYVSLLSPVIQSLEIKTDYTRLAATGDGKSLGWLYYLTSDPPALNERDLDREDSKQIAKGATLLKKEAALTDIGCCFAEKTVKRWVFYQTVNNSIYALNVKDNQVYNVTDNAKDGTPLAATSFVRGNNDILVVYWVRFAGGSLALARSHSSDNGAHWQESTLSAAATPSLDTLSTSSNPQIEENAVVFSASDDGKTQVHPDKWEEIKG